MSSYYDDPDFAEEYRRRDEEAIDAAVREHEDEVRLPDGCVGGHHPDLVSCSLGADWP